VIFDALAIMKYANGLASGCLPPVDSVALTAARKAVDHGLQASSRLSVCASLSLLRGYSPMCVAHRSCPGANRLAAYPSIEKWMR